VFLSSSGPTDSCIVLQRFSGPLYTFVALDANQDIYPHARADLDNLLESLVIDSK
jgi:hypothetical protein